MASTESDFKAKVEQIDVVDIDNADAELSDHLKRGEARIVRKVDWCLMPVFLFLMVLSFLDRSNIGFAASQGMAKDINLKGKELNVAVSIFYVFYILAEIPSSLIAKRLQFNRVIPGVGVSWGVMCLATGFVQNFAGLAVCRLLLGLFEGFLFPSMVLMMAHWYRREELGYRVGWVYICIAVSSAFGGLVAFAILQMDGAAGYPGWRWLYIIEGAVTVLFSFACFWLIPKDFENAVFLNADDKAIMRYRAEQTRAYTGGSGHYKMKDFMMAVKDLKTRFYAVNHMWCMTVIYGFSVFLPIILKNGFNFNTRQAQYLAIPVFLWGAIVLAVQGYISDRLKQRYISIVVVTPFGIAGYAILLSPVSTIPVGVRYFACFLVTTTIFVCAAGNFSWLSCNTGPDGKRAASVGITLTLCNVGGVVSGQIYILDQAPQFRLGHAYCLGCIVLSVLGWTALALLYKRREARKQLARAEEGYVAGREDLEDTDPAYRYQQ